MPPIKDRILLQREFLLRDKDGRNVDVMAKLYSLSGQTPYFSVTSQNGAAHEQIAGAAADEVRDDLAKLISIHLCDETGVPMHAVANAAYHLGEARFRDAFKSLGETGRIEDIHAVYQAVEDSLPEAVKAAEASAKEKAVRLAARRDREKDGIFGLKRSKMLQEDVNKLAAATGLKAADLDDKELAKLAKHGISPDTVKLTLTPLVRRRMFHSAVSKYAADVCFPQWKAAAEEGRAILAKPDFRIATRPPRELDRTTWEGFIAHWGLAMTATKTRMVDNMQRWDCVIVGKETPNLHGLGELHVDFGLGKAYEGHPPTIEQVLECLQSDFASVLDCDKDGYIEQFGMPESAKELRRMEQGYETVSCDYVPKFKEITGGEACYRELLTSVGDNPPLSPDHFAEQDAAPAP